MTSSLLPPRLGRYINAKFYYLGAQILLEAYAMKFDLKVTITIDIPKTIYALTGLITVLGSLGLW